MNDIEIQLQIDSKSCVTDFDLNLQFVNNILKFNGALFTLPSEVFNINLASFDEDEYDRNRTNEMNAK